MTREEIINEIKCLLSELNNGEDAVSYLTQNDVKWLKENIKALERQNVLFKSGLLKDCEICRAEQHPCEDAISREDAMSMILCYGNEIKAEVMDDIKVSMIKLPPVTPIRPKGHWIDMKYCRSYNDGDIETTLLKCSRCKDIVEWDIESFHKPSLHKPYYCENCGADMREVEE